MLKLHLEIDLHLDKQVKASEFHVRISPPMLALELTPVPVLEMRAIKRRKRRCELKDEERDVL